MKKETVKDYTYEYEYDVRGNLTVYKRNGNVLHMYEYDKLGRLSREDNKRYFYDNNGNITKVTSLEGAIMRTYQYDTNYSDLLVSFKGETIAYDSGNTYNPVSIGQYKTLTYKCNKLATYRDTNKGFCNHYFYDDLGNRVKKVKYNNSGTLLDTFKYYYDENGKLIHQKSNEYSLTFLYNELNQLYGFIYNETRYYYVRDAFNTINGIVDSTGNFVVQYNCDAWGNIVSINDTSGIGLGTINPFRYKGYYYDEETQLFYCNSRYYSPELCRWISPDSIEYLDPSSINGLNLYCYCMNNPIMYADPSGHLPEWAAWLISGAAIVGGIVLCATGVGGILGGVLIGAGAGSLINGYVTEANGGDFTAGYIGGAISGALCGVGAGLGGMAFAAASEVTNLACIGYMALGVTASFAGGFAGNLAGTVYTSWHNSGFKSVDINWGETLATSAIMGSLNILAGMGSAMSSIAGSMGRVATDVNSKFALRFLAGLIAGGTEAAYDLTSYLIGKLISAF